MTIAALDPEELACLEHLAMEGSRPDRCPRAILRRLLERRLIEPIPATWLPVVVVHPGYRLTAAGQLARREHLSKY